MSHFSTGEPVENGVAVTSMHSSLKKSRRRGSSPKDRGGARDRSNSSEGGGAKADRKPGVSPGGRKQVVFAGLDDNSSTSSDDQKHSEGGEEEEEVWVKRPAKVEEEDVPVTGVVIAKPSLCQYYPNNGAK